MCCHTSNFCFVDIAWAAKFYARSLDDGFKCVKKTVTPQTNPLDFGGVPYGTAGRQRFHREMSRLPEGVRAWLLPTGSTENSAPVRSWYQRET